MTTPVQDHNITRGAPFKPGILTLTAKDAAGTVLPVPVASYSRILCTVRKNKAVAQPDDTDTDVVAQISLVSNAQGVISSVGSNQVQLVIHGSVTRGWPLSEYFYDVEGTLTADGEPYILVKGTITVGWNATRTP